jgi:plasmid stabilization system protein ParE
VNRLPILRTASATQDITSILYMLFDEAPMAALLLQDAIDSTISQLSESPWVGEAYRHATIQQLRRVLVTGYSTYSIYYQVSEVELTIVRLIHNSRDLDSALATPVN